MEQTLLEKQQSITRLLFELLIKAGPASLALFLEMIVEVINVIIVGHIDKARVDGVGLGAMWANVTGVAVGWGIGIGLDTFCSQAYGNQDYRMVSVWFHRSLCVLGLFSVPICIAWLYTEEVLLAFGVPSDVAYYSYSYIGLVLPGVWCFFLYDFYRRFLQCQGYFWPGLLANGVTAALHVGWGWLLAVHFDYKEKGVGIATSILMLPTPFSL